MTKIVRIFDIDESYLAYQEDMDGDRIDDNPTLSIEEIANFCDSKAEGRNNHDYVGLHRILAALLYKHVPTHTLSIMKEIAEYGGLDAMNGLWTDEFTSAHETLGVPDDWSEWLLKDMNLKIREKDCENIFNDDISERRICG